MISDWTGPVWQARKVREGYKGKFKCNKGKEGKRKGGRTRSMARKVVVAHMAAGELEARAVRVEDAAGGEEGKVGGGPVARGRAVAALVGVVVGAGGVHDGEMDDVLEGEGVGRGGRARDGDGDGAGGTLERQGCEVNGGVTGGSGGAFRGSGERGLQGNTGAEVSGGRA
jgi:hypothetical protein